MVDRNWVDAAAIAERALERAKRDVREVVAEAAIWASPDAFAILPVLHPWARIARGGEMKGDTVLDWGPKVFRPVWDDPSNLAPVAVVLANEGTVTKLLLRVLGTSMSPARFVAKTVWPDTTADARYATCLANLVVLPSSIAPLLDLSLPARLAIRARAARLFGWTPAGAVAAEVPTDRPLRWRAPEALVPEARRALLRRRRNLARLPDRLFRSLPAEDRDKAVRAAFDFESRRRP